MKKKTSGLEQIYDGKWYNIDEFDKVACCDCALLHSFSFRLKNNRIQIKMERVPAETAALRRHFKHEFPKA